jgi:mRNA deadenylase 3'-5' endonuclease subunit Ccr4
MIATTLHNAEDGFNSTKNIDICPFDSNICTKDDFAAGDTTDQPRISNYNTLCPSDITNDLHGYTEDTPHPKGSSNELSFREREKTRC